MTVPAPEPYRPLTTPAELERRELEWWQKFAECEERFAWVQTPPMQRILRGRYVRDILKAAGEGGCILELGCGVGWLALVLAEAGATKVVGVDFSPAQIAIAKKRATEAGLDERVHFECLDGTQGGDTTGRYDCVLVHGFLHHLNQTEIARTLANVPRLLKPNGVLIVFEPVRHGTVRCPTRWERWQNFLARLASAGQRLGFRRVSPEEKEWRDLLASREWGVPPHGPSPKEMPFEPGELERFLAPCFKIERQSVCMAISHFVVQEWLLRMISHPTLTGVLLPWVARLAARLDRSLVSQAEPPAGLWAFTMFVCRPRTES